MRSVLQHWLFQLNTRRKAQSDAIEAFLLVPCSAWGFEPWVFLFAELAPSVEPKPGDLVCVVGASGGTRRTLTVELARKAEARVRYRSSAQSRRDFVGYRALPLERERRLPLNRSRDWRVGLRQAWQ